MRTRDKHRFAILLGNALIAVLLLFLDVWLLPAGRMAAQELYGRHVVWSVLVYLAAACGPLLIYLGMSWAVLAAWSSINWVGISLSDRDAIVRSVRRLYLPWSKP